MEEPIVEGEGGAVSASLRCFLVDDSASDLANLKSGLEELGHRVHSTQDPTLVEAELGRHGADIVFLDVVMPERNGYTVLRSVKKLFPGLPAVMVSSKNQDSDLNWAYLQGADGYLAKPYSVGDLRECMEKVAR